MTKIAKMKLPEIQLSKQMQKRLATLLLLKSYGLSIEEIKFLCQDWLLEFILP